MSNIKRTFQLEIKNKHFQATYSSKDDQIELLCFNDIIVEDRYFLRRATPERLDCLATMFLQIKQQLEQDPKNESSTPS